MRFGHVARLAALLLPSLGFAEVHNSSAQIEARMKEMIAAHEIPGVVTVVATRDGVHTQAVGHTGLEGSNPMQPNSIFWIASMTKPITGTAILMLQEAGKLSVDDPVAKYVPELGKLKTPSGQPANLTLKHLMTHTSGLPEATPDEAKTAAKLRT